MEKRSGEDRRTMPPLEYIVSPGEAGWFVTANGIDCGVVSDRETALRKALLWARETREQHGRQVRVLVEDGVVETPEGESSQPSQGLRQAAAAMRRPSSYFVRELAEFRPLYTSG
ncbi:MAG: hypothetical protein KIS68_16670 [Bauldia sp.]|nr:hypothetical protein [Bauldia sp.]